MKSYARDAKQFLKGARTFLSTIAASTLLGTAVILSACSTTPANQPEQAAFQTPNGMWFPGTDWTHVDPATLGLAPDKIERAVDYAKQQGSTAGMIVYKGRVLADWGDISRKSKMHSVRKSFMSALVGIAVSRGQLRLDDTLAQLGIQDNAPALTQEEQQATLRMLLEARSGVYHPSVYETAQMEASKPPRGSHAPGTFWYYNNWDFNTIGAVYEKASGERVFTALKTEIADPIGMQDYRHSDGQYVSGGLATRYPAYPFNMSARDLARFALLYLNNGKWRDQQVVPAQWVAESTHPYSNTFSGGYAYLWWTSVPATAAAPASNPVNASNAPGNVQAPVPRLLMKTPAFWADGYLGQYAVVVPSLDLVVVSLVDSKLTSKHMGQRQMARLVTSSEAVLKTSP